MNRLALLFAGQGAQSPTMGVSFLTHPMATSWLALSHQVLGYDVMDVITSNDGRLNQTLYTQPSIFVVSTMIWRVLQTTLKPYVDATLGFSLGEYAALASTEAFSDQDMLRLIQVRAQAMQEASTKHPGKMAAIIGLDTAVVQDLCRLASQSDAQVVVANLNCPGQIVISGHHAAVERAVQLATSKGARRAVLLNVSGAFHSPLMVSAQTHLASALKPLALRSLSFPIYMNVDARPVQREHLKQNMVDQLVSPVQFELSIRNMLHDGVTHFLEIGPGTVLQGLIKKIVPEAPVISLNEWSEMESVKGWLSQYGFVK